MKFKIAKKVILLFVFSVTILGATLGYYFIKQYKRSAVSELDERAKTMLNSLASYSEYPVMIKDRKAISKIVMDSLKQKDVVFVKIVDDRNNVLSQKGEEFTQNAKFYTSPIVVEKPVFEKNKDLILGLPEKRFEKIGEIYLTLSLKNLKKDLSDTVRIAALVTIIAIAITSFFVILLVRFFVERPIKELVIGTKKIGEGDLSYKIGIGSADELGDLAESFNKMAENLNHVIVSRDILNKEINERRKIEKQLIETEKMAAVAQITAETAHEIKNPLSVIKAGLYYVKMLIPDENVFARQTLQKMDTAVVRATGFIDDLLNISMPLDLKISQIDINNLIKESIKEIPLEIFAAIELGLDLSYDFPELAGDFNKLKQVMVNVIKNAAISVKESKTKKLTIKSRLDGDSLVLSVIDTGRGILKENIEKIFEPFYTQTKDGHGLGLTIAKRFVEAHHGTVEVTSEVGVGTAFTVRLPIKIKRIGG